MTWEVGSTDQQRLRAGCAVLAFGIAILLSAWGLSVLRGPESGGEAAIQNRKLDPPDPSRILPIIGAGMVVYGTVLIIVLFVCVMAFYRLSRNYRKHLLRKPPKPTPISDVWKMHRLPDESGGDQAAAEAPDGDRS